MALPEATIIAILLSTLISIVTLVMVCAFRDKLRRFTHKIRPIATRESPEPDISINLSTLHNSSKANISKTSLLDTQRSIDLTISSDATSIKGGTKKIKLSPYIMTYPTTVDLSQLVQLFPNHPVSQALKSQNHFVKPRDSSSLEFAPSSPGGSSSAIPGLIYQSDRIEIFIVISQYLSCRDDEVGMVKGDKVMLKRVFNDGWCEGVRILPAQSQPKSKVKIEMSGTGINGIFPMTCLIGLGSDDGTLRRSMAIENRTQDSTSYPTRPQSLVSKSPKPDGNLTLSKSDSSASSSRPRQARTSPSSYEPLIITPPRSRSSTPTQTVPPVPFAMVSPTHSLSSTSSQRPAPPPNEPLPPIPNTLNRNLSNLSKASSNLSHSFTPLQQISETSVTHVTTPITTPGSKSLLPRENLSPMPSLISTRDSYISTDSAQIPPPSLISSSDSDIFSDMLPPPSSSSGSSKARTMIPLPSLVSSSESGSALGMFDENVSSTSQSSASVYKPSITSTTQFVMQSAATSSRTSLSERILASIGTVVPSNTNPYTGERNVGFSDVESSSSESKFIGQNSRKKWGSVDISRGSLDMNREVSSESVKLRRRSALDGDPAQVNPLSELPADRTGELWDSLRKIESSTSTTRKKSIERPERQLSSDQGQRQPHNSTGIETPQRQISFDYGQREQKPSGAEYPQRQLSFDQGQRSYQHQQQRKSLSEIASGDKAIEIHKKSSEWLSGQSPPKEPKGRLRFF
ncbi:hypothetical protein HK098_000491 [Nowakowskiella sp. JEL0407]|nr:hypothetical protein HK098_000491 [Nowakowskiella sp. JEL0407]